MVKEGSVRQNVFARNRCLRSSQFLCDFEFYLRFSILQKSNFEKLTKKPFLVHMNSLYGKNVMASSEKIVLATSEAVQINLNG